MQTRSSPDYSAPFCRCYGRRENREIVIHLYSDLIPNFLNVSFPLLSSPPSRSSLKYFIAYSAGICLSLHSAVYFLRSRGIKCCSVKDGFNVSLRCFLRPREISIKKEREKRFRRFSNKDMVERIPLSRKILFQTAV